MIFLKDVVKTFGSLTAVDTISLHISQGEFFGFLGPNGAGKTTTIKMMTGLFAPTSGTITIGGYDIVKRPNKAKSIIGYIPDQPFLYDKLTGREFIAFVGGLFSLSGDELKRRIDRIIGHFEMGDWVDKLTEDYSQGMRQRISIAAALVHNPRIIIIDEPLIGLDPRSARVVKDTLKSLTRQGVTVFMSTHSLHVVEELCSRISIIKAGKIIFHDTLDKLDSFRERTDGKFESVFLELTK
jgi:ABC-2 type transport system ATP-binding protein